MMRSLVKAQPGIINSTHRFPPGRRALTALVLCLCMQAAGASGAAGVEQLVAGLDLLREQLRIPAFALVLVDRDRVLWSGARGTADLASGRPADDRTVFRIGSITKMFTATAMLMAVEDGCLQLDAVLREVVADAPLANPWQQSHPVRIAQLLEHTAGLADMSPAEFDAPSPLPLREALAWKAGQRRTLWPPGLHYSYSNVGAGFAALALETATGRTYEDFVNERIFTPLGMDSASFFPDAATTAALATGYDADGRTPIPYWHVLYRPFGAINVRPGEMAAFVRMLLNRGSHEGHRLLAPASVRRMETPGTSLAARSGLAHGYGLGNYRWFHKGVLFHGHGGDADGYLARLGYSRDAGLGYFLVINVFRQRDLERLRRQVEDFIAAGATPAIPPVHALPAALAQRYAGEYEAVTERFTGRKPNTRRIRIVNRGGGSLSRQQGSSSEPLLAVNDRHFRLAHEPAATSAFVRDGGDLYYQDDTGSYRKVHP